MTTRDEWLELAARCEKATGPDRDLAKDIARALEMAPDDVVTQGYGWREDSSGWWLATGEDARVCPKRIDPPPVLSSLDAITALIERELPGWERASSSHRGEYQASVYTPGYSPPILGHAATEALARCAAFCRAMAEKEQTP